MRERDGAVPPLQTPSFSERSAQQPTLVLVNMVFCIAYIADIKVPHIELLSEYKEAAISYIAGHLVHMFICLVFLNEYVVRMVELCVQSAQKL